MTTLVLLVLAVVWGLVLVSWLRFRSAEGAFTDSVAMFRRHLRVLERTSPVRVQPANRMRSGYVAGRPSLRPVSGGYIRTGLRPPTPAAVRRRQRQKRRRDVLLVLMAGVGLAVLVAAATQNGDAIVVMVLAILLLCAYVALLVRMHHLTVERRMKLVYLSQARREAVGEATGGGSEAGSGYGQLAMRRVAN